VPVSVTGSAGSGGLFGRLGRWRTAARVAAWVVSGVAVVVVLAVFVFPTRTYLDQRHQLDLAARQVRVLDQQNSELSAEAAKLKTTAEIERIAREQYHLVRPGEQAFAILPAPTPASPAPAAAASSPPTPRRAPGGLWHTLTGWLP
jgi:cell division protein FtsL